METEGAENKELPIRDMIHAVTQNYLQQHKKGLKILLQSRKYNEEAVDPENRKKAIDEIGKGRNKLALKNNKDR